MYVFSLTLFPIRSRIRRFTKNNFNKEKNGTIVTFPIKNLELKDYFYPEQRSGDRCKSESKSGDDDEEVLSKLTLEQIQYGDVSTQLLKCYIRTRGLESHKAQLLKIVEKRDLLDLACSVFKQHQVILGSKYNLIANICHDSPIGQVWFSVDLKFC